MVKVRPNSWGRTMRTVKPFRLKAARCRIQADKAETPEVRAHYLEIARAWERLSEDCDQTAIVCANTEQSNLRHDT